MNINEAKQIRLVEYLRIIGHSPVNARGCQYWYLSPLREERTPSFKVNDNLNEWYDFGLSAGGDIIELGKHLYRTGNVSVVLLRISENAIGVPFQQLQSRSVRPCPIEEEMENVEVRQVVLHGFCQRRIVCFCIRVQTVCKLPTVVGILVVLDRIGGTADTIGPPARLSTRRQNLPPADAPSGAASGGGCQGPGIGRQ